MSRKIICPRCGKVVDVGHDCENKYKDVRKRTQLSNSRWIHIRNDVRRRDGCCVLCFMEGRFTNGYCVHHIIPREINNHDDMIYNEDNCVFLCEACHHRVHGTKTSWKDYVSTFKEYINNGNTLAK